MKIRWMPVVLVALSLTSALARGQGYTEKGATLGGVAGALAGAAIGKHNQETAVGALIGGAVGVVTGAAIGNAKDSEIRRTQMQQQQMYWQMSRAVSTNDVVAMTRSGLSDHLIISHIQENGVQRRLEVSDVIALHQQGVSEPVINALQRAPLASVPAAPRPAPVIVEERYYSPRVYIHQPPYYRYPHYHYHHQPGISGRVIIGY
jgi:hypothetical protein